MICYMQQGDFMMEISISYTQMIIFTLILGIGLPLAPKIAYFVLNITIFIITCCYVHPVLSSVIGCFIYVLGQKILSNYSLGDF